MGTYSGFHMRSWMYRLLHTVQRAGKDQLVATLQSHATDGVNKERRDVPVAVLRPRTGQAVLLRCGGHRHGHLARHLTNVGDPGEDLE